MLKRISFTLLLFASSAALSSPPPDEIDDSLASVKASIADLESVLKGLRAQASAEEKALALIEKTIGQIAAQLHEQKTALAEKDKHIKTLKVELKAKEKQQKAHQKALAQQLRSMAKETDRDQLKQLLNQDDFAAIGRLLAYYPYLHRAREAYLRELAQSLASIDQMRAQLETEQAQLSVLHAQTKASEAALEAERLHRSVLLGDLQADIADKDQALLARYEEQYELETLLMHLHQQVKNPGSKKIKSLSQMQGKLPLPIPSAKNLAEQLKGEGAFLKSQAGLAVHPIHGGRVVFAEWLRGFGLLVIVDHGEGYISLYGHNQTLYVRPGDWIDPSETIARVGQSGGLAESGLYFEIRKDGHPLNLKKWMRQRT